MLNNRQAYSGEQLQRLIAPHKAICDMRGIDPRGQFDYDIAIRLPDECDG
jgi:hypothetical protein